MIAKTDDFTLMLSDVRKAIQKSGENLVFEKLKPANNR